MILLALFIFPLIHSEAIKENKDLKNDLTGKWYQVMDNLWSQVIEFASIPYCVEYNFKKLKKQDGYLLLRKHKINSALGRYHYEKGLVNIESNKTIHFTWPNRFIHNAKKWNLLHDYDHDDGYMILTDETKDMVSVLSRSPQQFSSKSQQKVIDLLNFYGYNSYFTKYRKIEHTSCLNK